MTQLTVEYNLKQADLDAIATSMHFELKPLQMSAAAALQLVAIAAAFGVIYWVGILMDVPQLLVLIAGTLLAFVIAVLMLFPIALLVQSILRFLLARQRRSQARRLEVFAKLIGTVISWRFDEDGMHIASAFTTKAVQWTEVRLVRVEVAFWVFEMKAASLLLPASLVGADVETLIRRHCKVINDRPKSPSDT